MIPRKKAYTCRMRREVLCECEYEEIDSLGGSPDRARHRGSVCWYEVPRASDSHRNSGVVRGASGNTNGSGLT
jgi:hypothetical protein